MTAFAYLSFTLLFRLLPLSFPDPEEGLAIRYRDRLAAGSVTAVTALPGQRVTFEAVGSAPGESDFQARARAGVLSRIGTRRWTWIAPAAPGVYAINVVGPGARDSITINAFVMVPRSHLRAERVNGYRIGTYPRTLGHPAGFIEVTRANRDTHVSPHFRLGQFVCKQAGGYPKYVVLDERLVHRLEALLERVNAAGYRASTFHIMSGYRTPAYNRALGNVANSRHLLGAAADIFIDEDGDGVMDDLNGDGVSDVRDAEVLYRLIDPLADGGLGIYPPTRAHGAFLHVDVRGRRARW